MKKKLLFNFLLVLLTLAGTSGLYSQIQKDSTNVNFDFPWIYPQNPTPSDSVFMHYTYVSNDGCPDYALILDSIAENRLYVTKKNISDNEKACTEVITKFETKLYLGVFDTFTEVYLNGEYFTEIYPNDCTYDKKGFIVYGKDACEGKIFVQEYTEDSTDVKLYLLEQMFTPFTEPVNDSTGIGKPDFNWFNEGDQVIFSASKMDSINNPADSCNYFGVVKCYELIDTNTCDYERSGVIVAGEGACAEKLFVKEIIDEAGNYNLYAFEDFINIDVPTPYKVKQDSVINDSTIFETTFYPFKVGDEIIFSIYEGIEAVKDSTNDCKISGTVKCYEIMIDYPECTLDKKGVVVAGKNLCKGALFIREITDYHTTPRLYAYYDMSGFDDMTNGMTNGIVKPKSLNIGDVVYFTGIDFEWMEIFREMTDSMNIMPEDCNIVGAVYCYELAEAAETFPVKGTAYAGKEPLTSGTAILFAKDFNKALNTASLDSIGNFAFDNLIEGDYTVYVVPELTKDKKYLPTFYQSEIKFKNAGYFNVTDSVENIAVTMRSFVKPVGTGKIYGNIYFDSSDLMDTVMTEECNCKMGAISSVYYAINVPVILYNANDEAVDWTLTDEFGNYVFDNIALASYKVVSETAAAYAFIPVDLSAGKTVVNADLDLKKLENQTDVKNPSETSVKIYPNPVTKYLSIDVKSAQEMEILNIEGRIIMQHQLSKGNNTFDLSDISKGLYFIKIGDSKIKLMKQ